MRDIKRINRILKKIEDIWNKSPDQRFGQLLINMGIVKDDIMTWRMEDDILEKVLDEIKKTN